jgi:putative SOS response-associated peptidase YedK
MCNLYSQKKSQAEVRDLAKAMVDRAGNMPSLPAIFPNGKAPVVRALPSGERELLMMRWGFPSPFKVSRSLLVTNVRNAESRYWKPYLRPMRAD